MGMLMLSQVMADMDMEDTQCPGSAMVMAMAATAMVIAAIAGQATPIMDMAMVATLATAGQATPTMDTEAITSVMLMLSQATADMAMEDTPCQGSAMVMGMAVTVTVTAATAGQATPIMDMAMVATPATAGQATPTTDTEAITSVMLMLSPAMEAMSMEATPGPAMAVMVMGATPMCTDLPKDLVHRMDPMDMVTTEHNQTRAEPTSKPPMQQKPHSVMTYAHKRYILLTKKCKEKKWKSGQKKKKKKKKKKEKAKKKKKKKKKKK